MLKDYIQKRLESYVRKYFAAHPEIKLIVVTGSVGKTSTKYAIGTILSQRYRVRMHSGNHNTLLSAPLAILGINYPRRLKSIIAWLQIFRAAKRRIKQPADVDVIVQELGTDHPGEIAQFARFLAPDIALITAVTPEHMEFFGTIDAVAQEELSAGSFAKHVLINRDDIDDQYAKYLTNSNLNTYGSTGLAEYRFEIRDFTPTEGYDGAIIAPELIEQKLPAKIRVFGEHSLRPVMGGVAVAFKMGLIGPEISAGLAEIRPVPGRMNVLRGIDNTTIIDDTYNSSPAAAEAAVQVLYTLVPDAPQRIAILGSMNELGAVSQIEHERLGAMCDPGLLAWVITIGEDAEKYLAPAARARGCQVKSFGNAIEAGQFARSVTEEGAVILVKGSQGAVYAEEATKILCNMTEDIKLVRQSERWMNIKNDFFSKFK